MGCWSCPKDAPGHRLPPPCKDRCGPGDLLSQAESGLEGAVPTPWTTQTAAPFCAWGYPMEDGRGIILGRGRC